MMELVVVVYTVRSSRLLIQWLLPVQPDVSHFGQVYVASLGQQLNRRSTNRRLHSVLPDCTDSRLQRLLPSGGYFEKAEIDECYEKADIGECYEKADIGECYEKADIGECYEKADIDECYEKADIGECHEKAGIKC